MNKTKLGFKSLYIPVLILFMGIGVQILISCSSGGGGDTPHGGGSVSSGTDDPALYCVIDALGYCVTGLGGKQCRDDGYRGNSGYSDTKCPSGYDIITKVGSALSSSSGGSSLNRDYCVVENTFNGIVTGVCFKHFEDCDVYGNSGRWSNNCPKDYTCVDYLNSVSCDNNSSSSSSSIVNIISSSSSIGVSSSSSSSSSSIGNAISSSSSIGVNVSSSSNICANAKSCTAACNTETHYCSNGTMKEYGFVTDDGGQTYKTVVIGTQTWMAENLNYNISGSTCNSDCVKYGRLYTWYQAMTNVGFIEPKHPYRGACPQGWHIPIDTEWTKLTNFVGSDDVGTKLKATSSWPNCGPSGSGNSFLCEDTYGFSALMSSFSNGWWTANEPLNHYLDPLLYTYIFVILDINNYDSHLVDKYEFYSVRCLKD